MPAHLFEYAVIRIVPRVEREEFLNTGVVLYCAEKKYLQTYFSLNQPRLQAFCGELDLVEIKRHLDAFKWISEGVKEGGPLAVLDAASRFRWLTATRSTVLQTSKVHPGFCTDPGEELIKLYKQLVAC